MATLLELLVEHLEEWPEGVHAVVADNSEGAHFVTGGMPAIDKDCPTGLPFTILEGADSYAMWGASIDLGSTPSDYQTAIITREMWEDAKK